MLLPKTTLLLALAVLVLLVAVLVSGLYSPFRPTLSSPDGYPLPSNTSVKFAVIGDYGWDGKGEADVAALIHRLDPDFILTVGDNNYPSGSASTIDLKIGKYYHDFIYPYPGRYGNGSDVNRFFPVPGNHDWGGGTLEPYLEYFTLPGNERYYDFVWGPVHFFALDGEPGEPDGMNRSSVQAEWLRRELAAANETWKIVYVHRPPYSSSNGHGSTSALQWPFREWGATAVLSGHDHVYERLVVDGLPYFVNGIGGATLYSFGDPIPGSEFRYDEGYGAMMVSADTRNLTFRLYTDQQEILDTFTLDSK